MEGGRSEILARLVAILACNGECPVGYTCCYRNKGLSSLLSQVSWTEDRLSGRFAGSIGTGDASRHPHILFDLRLRDGRLAGQATAQTTIVPAYFALNSYAELRKRAATSFEY